MTNALCVLFTRELNERNKTALYNTCYDYRELPFIQSKPIDPSLWLKEASNTTDAWIFTSSKAIESVCLHLDSLTIPDFIFTVGSKSAQQLSKYKLNAIYPDVHNATHLAGLISKYSISRMVHFCGNLKAVEFEELLDTDSLHIQSIQVYETILTPVKVDLSYIDGLVFMSPSAVRSFFSSNRLDSKKYVFCIGSTTASELEKYSDASPITPKEFSFTSLVEMINQTLC